MVFDYLRRSVTTNSPLWDSRDVGFAKKASRGGRTKCCTLSWVSSRQITQSTAKWLKILKDDSH